MTPTEDLLRVLKKLRLSGLSLTLEMRIKQACDDNLGHTEFLFRLLNDEVERRDARQGELRLRRAAFDSNKTLEEFDFMFNSSIPKSKVIDLAACTFLLRKENILLVGKTGVGKSHIAQAIGHRACMAGHKVLFTSANDMLLKLRAARADDTHDRLLAKYCAPDLLIIDDLGLRALRYDEPIDLYELIRRRYERGSIIFTSNRDVSEWAPLFKDELLASAAMDRLLHHAHILVLDGESYRNPPKRKAA